MAQRLLPAIQQVFSDLGYIGIGYKLKTYATLTTTPLTTYSDEGLTTPNANPASGATTGNQISNGDGRFGDMWVSNLSLYKIVLTDNNDVPLVTADPVDGGSSSSIIIFNPMPEAFWGTTAGTSTAYTLDSNVDISSIGYQDTQIFKASYNVACGIAPTLAVDGLAALNLKKYTGLGTKIALEAGDVVAAQTYDHRNDGVDIVVLNPEHPANLQANTTIWRGLTYLPSPVTVANGTDTNHDINFSAGVAILSNGNSQVLCSAEVKRINEAWTAGTENGGLAAGLSVSNNTTYHLFALASSSYEFIGFGYDTNINASNLLVDANVISAGGTTYGRIAALRTDGSANILNGTYYFNRDGSYTFKYKVGIADITTVNPGVAAIIATVSTPAGVKTRWNGSFSCYDDSADFDTYGLITSMDDTDSTPSVSLFQFIVPTQGGGNDSGSAYPQDIYTNTSNQVRYRLSASTAAHTVYLRTFGWSEFNL